MSNGKEALNAPRSLCLKMRIKIKPELVAAIERHARSDLKNEVCGLLYADRYLPLKNNVSDPCRFEVDPAGLARALAIYGEPLAIFHTHPNDGLFPSDEDLQQSYYKNSMMIVGAIVSGKFEYRVYRIPKAGTYEVVAPPQLEPAPAVHP